MSPTLRTGLSAVLLTALPLAAAEPVVVRDVEFARVGGRRLALDLYRPPDVERPPVVVWVHGGAWRKGARTTGRP